MTDLEDNFRSRQTMTHLPQPIGLPHLTELKRITKVSGGLLILLAALTWLLLAAAPLATAQISGFPLVRAWSSAEVSSTYSVAWGDVDGDGDLDLAIANSGQPNRLYRNDNGVLTANAVWSSDETDNTGSIAWRDVDGDGDFDLAVGNHLYRNEGGVLTTKADWYSPGTDPITNEAWGDMDGDGDLDLAVANWGHGDGGGGHTELYRNDNGVLTLIWSSIEACCANSVAWGDVDGDGDLDLAVGNSGTPNWLYRNDNGMLTTSPVWSSVADHALSVAWGDVDGDGDLDLAVGNWGQPNRLYRNENGVLTLDTSWSPPAELTLSVAWGDVDGDGDLDLAVGNRYTPNRLYRNDNGMLSTSPVWSSDEVGQTQSVAWGDVDGDGDLDLAVGNQDQPNRLYRNDNGVLKLDTSWAPPPEQGTYSVAWGDVDGDGDLDLAVGGRHTQLYRNDNGVLTLDTSWSPPVESTTSVAWGDVDGDGDLDLAVGNWGQPNRLYRNDNGVLSVHAVWSSVEADYTNSVAWGDADGDGDLDLVAGNSRAPKRLYRNDNGILTSNAVWSSAEAEADWTNSVAWGDIDGDGDLDLAAGGYDPDTGGYTNIRLYKTQTPAHPLHAGAATAVNLDVYSHLAPANFYAVPGIHSGTIPISYTISDPETSSTWRVRGFFSPDGGGRWFPAVAGSGTITRNVASGVEQVYRWDVGASGFLGQSDNVVFRLEALPGGPLPSQRPFVSAQTYPFRVRGTQVQVVNEAGQPVQGALVYRRPAGQSTGGPPIGGPDTPFRTDALGYLSGRGQIGPGDQLVALWPVSQTEKFTFYHTSARPSETGLNAFTVSQSGVQTLTVSAANPLILFNLAVSLEWDASANDAFLADLQDRLNRASAALYDWTNGQAALGRVTVYQNKEHWNEADVRILASNQTRPNATRGGIVTTTTVLDFGQPTSFSSGQIRIGPTWTRYGNIEGSLDDWSNGLAHELGHYALFLEDTYLGLKDGLLIPNDTCTGTAMSDPYLYSEFRYNTPDWPDKCGQTLAELPDWELIRRVYPALHSPPPENSGPTQNPPRLPFDFTQIEVRTRGEAGLLGDFDVPIPAELVGGQAYLFHPGQGLVDLGRPRPGSSLTLLRGARQGDVLCLFAATHFACSQPLDGSEPSLPLQPAWLPEVALSPVNSTTLQILITTTTTHQITATFYPNGATPLSKLLTPGQLKTISFGQPALDVLVDLVGDDRDKQRLVTGYATGAGPGRRAGHGGPVTSSDGNVIIYPPDLPDDQFLTLQTAPGVSQPPAGVTIIGQSYFVRASAGTTNLAGGSLAFEYFELEVLLVSLPQDGQAVDEAALAALAPANSCSLEKDLVINYWDGSNWTPLKTTVDCTHNFASARTPGPGLYTLAWPSGPSVAPNPTILYFPIIMK